MKTKKSVWIVLVVIVLGYCGINVIQATRQSGVENNSRPGIAYKYLSNEDVEPFLWNGRLPAFKEGRGRLNAYVRAAKKMHDVGQCLIESEQKKEKPDLRLIDWRRLGTGSKLDVCLFRIFSSLGSLQRAAKWMKYHQMEVKIPSEFDDYSGWLDDSAKGPLLLQSVFGAYYPKRTGRRLGASPAISDWVIGWFRKPYLESISSRWTENGKVMGVSFAASYK